MSKDLLMRVTNNIAEASEYAEVDPRVQRGLKKLVSAATRVIKSQDQPRRRSFCGIGPVKFEAAQKEFGKDSVPRPD
jgi:hypothetical protein